MVTRLRIGGLVLSVQAGRATPSLRLPRRLEPFLTQRGSDIRLRVIEAEVPAASSADQVFDSGGIWRAYRQGRRVLYSFRSPTGKGPPARGLLTDTRRRRGRLYLPLSRAARRPGFALSYPLDELLFQHHLAWRGGVVVHACGVVVDGKVLLFLGQSGAGKTTLARLWKRYRPGTPVLSDDRLVVRRRGTRFWAWGTPWHGSGRFASPHGRTLAGLFFLQQARETRCSPVSAPVAAGRLFARSFPPPWEAAAVARVLETCDAVTRQVPCFTLRFRPDSSVVSEVLERLAASRA